MGELAEKTNTEQTGGESKSDGGNPAPGEKKDAPKVSLKKNAIYNLISKLLAIITPFITTPYLARVLGEEGNGQISYVSSIIAYFTLAASLGFSVYGQREIAKCQDDREQRSLVFWEIFTTKVILTCLSLAVESCSGCRTTAPGSPLPDP